MYLMVQKLTQLADAKETSMIVNHLEMLKLFKRMMTADFILDTRTCIGGMGIQKDLGKKFRLVRFKIIENGAIN